MSFLFEQSLSLSLCVCVCICPGPLVCLFLLFLLLAFYYRYHGTISKKKHPSSIRHTKYISYLYHNDISPHRPE